MHDVDDTVVMMAIGLATYSPEDNKLRLYPHARLDSEIYDRVHGNGFTWAPKQELFVAPAWTPDRFDLLVELCGDVADDDTSLVDRAEERAERFEDYSEKRLSEAERTRDAVEELTGRFSGGQPILVGHHSEKQARKDKERIESGMRKSIRLWETSKYWTQRAAGALRHAKYKERPAVRARRIKTLEADKRKRERTLNEAQKFLRAWNTPELSQRQAELISNYDHVYAKFPVSDYPRKEGASTYEGDMSLHSALQDGIIDGQQAKAIAIPRHEATIAYSERWIDHLSNRIAYERAMLDEQGGLVGEQVQLEVGGRVLIGKEWLSIVRVTKAGGVPVSVTTNGKYARKRGIEEILSYEPPTAEQTAAAKAATKLPPLCNYPGDGFKEMTLAEWQRVVRAQYGSTRIRKATESLGAHRVREAMKSGYGGLVQVYLTDQKVVPAPAVSAPATEAMPRLRGPEPSMSSDPVYATKASPVIDEGLFAVMKDTLRNGGVTTVSAPQLFPTPEPIVQRMLELAEIAPGQRVLEPSAGTGRLLVGIRDALSDTQRTAVEINPQLCNQLRQLDPDSAIVNADFLAFDSGERFDRIVMNPPFVNAEDIAHIKHAIGQLAPGGKLVALCANGPRQNATLRPLVEQRGGTWETLPPGSFQSSGTGVNVALLSLTLP